MTVTVIQSRAGVAHQNNGLYDLVGIRYEGRVEMPAGGIVSQSPFKFIVPPTPGTILVDSGIRWKVVRVASHPSQIFPGTIFVVCDGRVEA